MLHIRKQVPEQWQATGQLYLFMLTFTMSGVVGNLLAGHLLLGGYDRLLFGGSAVASFLAAGVFLLLRNSKDAGQAA